MKTPQVSPLPGMTPLGVNPPAPSWPKICVRDGSMQNLVVIIECWQAVQAYGEQSINQLKAGEVISFRQPSTHDDVSLFTLEDSQKEFSAKMYEILIDAVTERERADYRKLAKNSIKPLWYNAARAVLKQIRRQA